VKFCKENCENLTPKESGTENFPESKMPHHCTRYIQSVYHRTFYPRLVRLSACEGEGEEV
jgi:hypothetical protein